MSDFIIYHNPRCSKSRQTLEILNEKDIDTEIVLYLENPPSAKEVASILQKLGLSSRDIIRKGEEEYKLLNIKDQSLTENELIALMSENPKLIERPIVVKDDKAIIGRPPENVLSLL
jgi:arsenate reductase